MSTWSDEEYAELAYESDAAADRHDDRYDGICRRCGFDEHCGCPMDINTMSKMSCPSCGGQWWRAWGDESTTCLHRRCRADGSVVARAPLYAPRGEDGTP